MCIRDSIRIIPARVGSFCARTPAKDDINIKMAIDMKYFMTDSFIEMCIRDSTLHSEMQMLASGSGAGISRHPQLLTGINHVTYLYCYVRQLSLIHIS